MNFYICYLSYLDYAKLKQKPQSYNSMENKFKNHILPYFKDYNLCDIKFLEYLNWQKIIDNKNFSYNYKKNLHLIFSAFLDFCVNCYGLERNVSKQVGNFSNKNIKKKEMLYYTFNEFELFINCVDNFIYKCFFEFLFFTGARPGEAMALKFSDLNDEVISINKTIDEHGYRNVGSPKSFSSYRDISINNDLVSKINELYKIYVKKYDLPIYDYYIFGGIKPLAPTTINRYKKKACEKSNIKEIRLHDFRHSHATLLIDNGIPINEISRRLGHNNIVTTLNTYVHNNKNNEKRVLETLNSLHLN